MAYTVHQAKTHFSRLLKQVEAGEEVIVMRGSHPVAKLVPFEPIQKSSLRRQPGGFEGLAPLDESALEPLSAEQLSAYGFETPLENKLRGHAITMSASLSAGDVEAE
jgi:prevent-host-death family protein